MRLQRKQQHRFHAFGTGPALDFDSGTLACYLKIAGYMSRVFDERTAAATFAQVYDVLDTSSTSQINELFDQQLLAAWLNFANGAIEWNRLVDTNGDKKADTQSSPRSEQRRPCASTHPPRESS